MNQEAKQKRQEWLKSLIDRYPAKAVVDVDYDKVELRVVRQLLQTGVFAEAPEGALKPVDVTENERLGRIYVNHEIGWL